MAIKTNGGVVQIVAFASYVKSRSARARTGDRRAAAASLRCPTDAAVAAAVAAARPRLRRRPRAARSKTPDSSRPVAGRGRTSSGSDGFAATRRWPR